MKMCTTYAYLGWAFVLLNVVGIILISISVISEDLCQKYLSYEIYDILFYFLISITFVIQQSIYNTQSTNNMISFIIKFIVIFVVQIAIIIFMWNHTNGNFFCEIRIMYTVFCAVCAFLSISTISYQVHKNSHSIPPSLP